MLRIGYLVDSAANVLKEWEGQPILKKVEFLSFIVIDPDSKEYSEDRITISQENLIGLFNKFPKKGLKTSLTPRVKIEAKLDEMFKKYDFVIGLPIGRGLSNQSASFDAVANLDKYKGKFFTYGTRNATDSIITDIMEFDKELLKLPKLDQEIFNSVVKSVEAKVSHDILLYVSQLDRLLLSGRISKVKAVVGKIIKLKVAFTLDDEKVDVIDKGRSIFQLINSTVTKKKQELQNKFKNSIVQAAIYMFDVEKSVQDKVVEVTKGLVDKVSVEDFPAIYLVHLGPGTIAINLTVREKA